MIAGLNSCNKTHKPDIFTIKTLTRKKKKAKPYVGAVTKAKSGVEAHRE